ncbi:MAG: NusG domain II-containing protein [Clostridia bacterium]|nr:NusG domain II-containing protein [Clostridia bacterium]
MDYERIIYIVNRKRNINDIILIIMLIVLPLAALSLNLAFGEKPGSDSLVVITVMGELYDKVPLNQDTVIEIETELGINRIEIKDEQVWMSYADCPDQLCVNHKAVSLTGGQIVCLPNQVVVSVESSIGSLDSISE